MVTIALDEDYINILRGFGEPDKLINQAVEEYLAKRIKERLGLTRRHEVEYEEKYGMDYETFHRRMALDEDYYNQTNHLNPLWEQDALEWEYWHEEVRDWTSKLEAISSDF